jgi:hypothetical protein
MTDFDAQDDILEGWQDEGRPELTQEEQESRVRAFQVEVDKRIEKLMRPRSYGAAERREAARWLGESGEIRAIEPLTKVYRKDPTPGMKETAAYALGQFKALEQALSDPDREMKAMTNLENIVLYREFGGRSGGSNRGLQMGLGALLIVLLLVGAGINVTGIASRDAAPTLVAGGDLPTPTPDTLEWRQTRLRNMYVDLRDDADLLRAEFQQVTRESGRGGQDCDVTFNDPDEITMTADSQPVLVDIAEQLNEIENNLDEVLAGFRQACRENRPLTSDEVLNEYGDELTSAQRQLVEVVELFETGSIEIPPTGVPTETPVPSPTPEPTVDPQEVNRHRLGLQQIITDMTAQRGAASRVQIYWNGVQETGSQAGCNQIPEPIPPDYDLPDDIAARLPDLERAAVNVNIGLDLTRRSQDAFFEACENNNLSQIVGQQVDVITTAINAFEDAQQNLNDLGRPGS